MYTQVCTLKTLPQSLRVAAAEKAIEINPYNSRPMQRAKLAMSSSDVVIPPEHLSLLVNKYWGVHGVHLTVGFLDNPPYGSSGSYYLAHECLEPMGKCSVC